MFCGDICCTVGCVLIDLFMRRRWGMAGSLLTKLRSVWQTVRSWEGNYEVKVACSSKGGVIVVRAGLANESGDGVVLQPSVS